MKHNLEACLSKVRDEIKEGNPEITWVDIMLSNIVSLDEMRTSKKKAKKTGQNIRFGYEYKKKNGETVSKVGKSFISHSYCPFCGKKFE